MCVIARAGKITREHAMLPQNSARLRLIRRRSNATEEWGPGVFS